MTGLRRWAPLIVAGTFGMAFTSATDHVPVPTTLVEIPGPGGGDVSPYDSADGAIAWVTGKDPCTAAIQLLVIGDRRHIHAQRRGNCAGPDLVT
jgi:hypothetical protein